jgi:non-ribosomal peptide synthase protein (TIGR01720 family)
MPVGGRTPRQDHLLSTLGADHARGPNTVASARFITTRLGAPETTALLQEVPTAYHTHIHEVLVTALLQAVTRRTGSPRLVLELEGHGREDLFEQVDLSRTVGWFTTRYPVHLHVDDAASPGEALKTVKEQLRQVPRRGLGYGLLRYLHPDPSIRQELAALPGAALSFNYLGQFDQVLSPAGLFRLARESSGPTQHSDGLRRHPLEIDGAIVDGQLQLRWTYSEHLHRAATIETLAAEFLDTLSHLIRHCQSVETSAYTPSDFPNASVSQEQLNRIVSRIRSKN